MIIGADRRTEGGWYSCFEIKLCHFLLRSRMALHELSWVAYICTSITRPRSAELDEYASLPTLPLPIPIRKLLSPLTLSTTSQKPLLALSIASLGVCCQTTPQAHPGHINQGNRSRRLLSLKVQAAKPSHLSTHQLKQTPSPLSPDPQSPPYLPSLTASPPSPPHDKARRKTRRSRP